MPSSKGLYTHAPAFTHVPVHTCTFIHMYSSKIIQINLKSMWYVNRKYHQSKHFSHSSANKANPNICWSHFNNVTFHINELRCLANVYKIAPTPLSKCKISCENLQNIISELQKHRQHLRLPYCLSRHISDSLGTIISLLAISDSLVIYLSFPQRFSPSLPQALYPWFFQP